MLDKNQVVKAIRQRRSVRRFTEVPVSSEDLSTVMEAGIWAPSGMDNQPWRFIVVQDPAKKDALAGFTKYGTIIRNAPVCIVVFMDLTVSYHQIKDSQAMGACLQNMLLAAHSLDLGAVWLGEILKNKDQVRDFFDLPPTHELHAVVALGHPASRDQKSERRPLDDVILARY